uniref:Uncharacterized protein n=1 Tax=viral metagenome TaxID=1070528 RepID=A0A6C0DU73_9ZZZZ
MNNKPVVSAEPTERIWYLITSLSNTISNTLFRGRKTPIQKEQDLFNQIMYKHQFLVIVLPNESGNVKKVTIPIVISGRVKPLKQIDDYIENNYPNLTDSEYDLIDEAYNEWYELYNQLHVNSQIQPILTTANISSQNEAHTLAEISNLSNENNTNNNSNNNVSNVSKIPSATSLPHAYKIGRGKKTKKNRKRKQRGRKTKNTRR